MGRVRVLVTRPQPGADRTAARLTELGFEPVVLPLTQAVPLPQTLPDIRPDLVVATSPQAFRHLPDAVRETLMAIPVLVTGEGTAAAARHAGFHLVETSGGNVAGLEAKLANRDLSLSRVLYLAGKIRRPDLENFLQKKLAKFELIEVYDTKSVSYSTDKFHEIVSDGFLSATLVTSLETVAALAAIALDEFRHAIDKTVFICLSERIAMAAGSRFSNRLLVADTRSEQGLLDCLMKAFPHV